MRKKFTMLLASLFLAMGTAWAQTAVVGLEEVPTTPVTALANIGTGYYLIKEVNANQNSGAGGFMKADSENAGAVVAPQGNNALDAANVDATYIWYIEKGEGTHTIATANKKAAWQAPWQGQKNLVAYGNKANLVFATTATAGSQSITADAGSFVVQDADKKALVHYSGGKLGSWNDANPKSVMMFELYLIPNEDLKVSGLVDLTIQYKFGGEVVGTTTITQQVIGESCTIPALAFTSVASCAVGNAAATEGATIVVPNANSTVTVILENNLPFEVSADYENAIWYALQIRGNQNVVNNGDNISSKAPLTASEGALWAFMGNPFDGIQVLNKAAGEGKTLALDGTAKMKEGSKTWNILENGTGFILRDGNSGNNCLNDVNNVLSTWNNQLALTDPGSTFTVISEAEMIAKATAALNDVNTTINTYDKIEATYYIYPQANVDAAKARLEGITTPNDILSALQVKIATDAAVAALSGKSDGPKAGDFIILKNKAKNEYMTTMDSGDEVHRTSNKNNPKALWQVVAGDDSKVKLYNVESEKYLGALSQSAKVLMVEEANAAQFTFSNVADAYAAFTSGGGSHTYAHMDSWYDRVVGWEAASDASHWLMTQAYPLTVVFNFKGEEIAEYSINTYATVGSTYMVKNPFVDYGKRYMNVACTVNGSRVELDGDNWPVPVMGETSVIITVTENLPFKTSKDFDTANWQYLQINSGSWKYVRNFVADGDENTYSNTTDVAALGDNAQWAFVGDALHGFKILNKAAGDGYTLSFDGDVSNGTAAYIKQEEKTWTIEKGNGGFVIRQGETECLNDFGGKLKVWKDGASPSGTGSAFRTISASVADLADLCFPGVFTLQAERSPLLYDASANVADANKLSSGMASGIAANGNDANQQFLISESETDGLYYLYSVGAARFVDANLNFTEIPQPVLSFEANKGNAIFPWFVKIGGKYVVPGANGTAGNKLYHTETPEPDAGKWYRIEKVDEDLSLAQSVALIIQYSEGLIKDAEDMSNNKVYTVSTFDRGKWYYREGEVALWSTGKEQESKPDENDAEAVEKAEKADKFAFLTVNGKTYLYSVGAGKFVVKSETQHDGMYYATYSDTPAQTVELLAATNGGWFPVVVKLNVGEPNQLAISNGYDYPVVMHNNLADPGNQVRIEEAEGAYDLSAVVARIEAYQLDEEAKGGLQTLITEATTKNEYLDNAALTAAITAAQAALDKVGATYDEWMTAKTSLAAALNSALCVTEINGFSNNYVYTFVSKRGWMGALAAAEKTNVISTAKNTVDPEASDANTLFQWAVYTSESGKQYLYNIGKQKFMGVQSTNNASVPFAATPQGQLLTFKKSDWADYPIMFSTDNAGVVNHSRDYGEGLVTWTDGWKVKNDEGSNHKVTIVGKIEAATLSSIAAAVELYETRGVAIQNLDAAIAAAQVKVGGMGEGLGYYSSTDDNAVSTLAAIVEFKNAISDETTVADVESQTAAANDLIATFSVNLPEAGKFYRFKHPSEDAYMLSDVTTVSSKKRLAMGALEGNEIKSVFYYKDGTLLSYAIGQYLSGATKSPDTDWTCIAVGADAPTATFGAGSALGTLGFYLGGDATRAYYSGRKTYVDAGGSFGSNEGYNWVIEEVTTLPVTVTSAGYATLYAPVALAIPDGVTAYTAKVADAYVSLTKIEGNVIPANTGVMLQAEAATYNFVITAEEVVLESDFVGSLPKSNMKDGVKTYTLQAPKDGVGFYRFKGQNAQGETTYINGFRAWVELPGTSAVQSLRIRFADTTEIEGSEFDAQGSQLIFDLTGRRIEKIVEKGVYIVNGKKVIIR